MSACTLSACGSRPQLRCVARWAWEHSHSLRTNASTLEGEVMAPSSGTKRNGGFNTGKTLLWIVAAGFIAIVASVVIGTVIITREVKTAVTSTADKVGQVVD